MFTVLRLVLFVNLLLAMSLPALAADLGVPAPELAIKKWVHGEPVLAAAADGKSVVVLAFVDTDSPMTSKTLGSLSEVAERDREKGVRVVAISRNGVPKMEEALGGRDLHCSFGADDGGKSFDTYASSGLLPHLVIVDRKGRVAWQGHPIMGFVDAFAAILDGTYDLDAAIAEEKREKVVSKLESELETAVEAGDTAAASAAAEKLLDLDPSSSVAIETMTAMLGEGDDPGPYHAFIAQLTERASDDWNLLNNIAWSLVTADLLDWRHPELAEKAGRRALELTNGEDPSVLDTYGRILYTFGRLEKAIDYQRKAIALDDAEPGLRTTLDYYEACLKARDKLGE